MTALVPFPNANVSRAQRISFLAAAAPSQNELSAPTSLGDFIESVNYEATATMLRQCHQSKTVHEKGIGILEPWSQSIAADSATF